MTLCGSRTCYVRRLATGCGYFPAGRNPVSAARWAEFGHHLASPRRRARICAEHPATAVPIFKVRWLNCILPRTPEPLISNVSDTAHWMAADRAVESVRPDALFNDPFAN